MLPSPIRHRCPQHLPLACKSSKLIHPNEKGSSPDSDFHFCIVTKSGRTATPASISMAPISLKKYAHHIILVDDADLIAKFPQQEGKVTVLKLASVRIQSISYWNPESEPVDNFLK